MRISSRGEYGLRALIDLAEQYGRGPVACADIAARQQIPENYLTQILIALRNAGLIQSTRGPQGGHQLSRTPQNIRLVECLSVLEGPVGPVITDRDDHASMNVPSSRALREVWEEVRVATEKVLDSRNLADLTEVRRSQNSKGK
ncbi:MAG: Rrf2 family transcriptional regulator [Chloroflexi bacterium]|nr:Rrf2 family transcriptional regulator [Chloroflexota bacterium]